MLFTISFICVAVPWCLCAWLAYENWRLRSKVDVLNRSNTTWRESYEERWEETHELRLQLKEEKGHSTFYSKQLGMIESVLNERE